MECSCAIEVDYSDFEDPVEMFEAKEVVANKSHKCIECERTIEKGEMYERASYKHEGVFFVDKTCADCLSARKQFYPNGGYCPGGLWTDIQVEVDELSGEISETCISKLTPKARERLLERIELWDAE